MCGIQEAQVWSKITGCVRVASPENKNETRRESSIPFQLPLFLLITLRHCVSRRALICRCFSPPINTLAIKKAAAECITKTKINPKAAEVDKLARLAFVVVIFSWVK